MDFPHLQGDTPFPGSDAHVYEQYANTYDYHMWTPRTKIKLCHVRWRDDGRDAVKFKDDATRDAWFDALDGETVTLTASMYIARADTDGVKIPVPYMTAQRYNYIVVDYTPDIMQSPMQKTDCQTRYHYFITQTRAEAPNTTTVVLERDMWTDYINTTRINGLLLARGHAPLTETTPAVLLENPRENSADMLAPDVDYGGTTNRITDVKATPLTGGEKHICLACAFDPAQLAAMAATRGADVTGTNPAYSGDDGTVTAWTWGAGGVDVRACRTLGTAYAHPHDRIPSNHTVYALRASAVTGAYIDELFARYPHIANGIAACFVMSADMFAPDTATATNVAGVDWTPITGTERTVADIRLTPDDFDMPDTVRDVARLYVSPYSTLEVTDVWGKTVTVNVEDCGRLSVRSLVSAAYPLIRQAAYLDGVGASGTTAMDVLDLDGHAMTGDIPNADALRTVMSYDIPTYALQRRNIDAYRGANYNRAVVQGRENAITAYENAAQSANTAKTNTQKSLATAQGNTQRANNAAAAGTARANAANTATTNLATAAASALYNIGANKLRADVASTNHKIGADQVADQRVANAAYSAGVEQSALTNVTSTVAGVATALVGVAAAGATTAATGGAAAPFAIGAAAGLGTAGIDAGLSGTNTAIAITNQQALYEASYAAAASKTANARDLNNALFGNSISCASEQTNTQNKLATDTTAAANAASTDITATNVAASNANALATKQTGDTNAAASRDQTITNAKRAMTTTHDNAANTFADMTNQPPAPVGAYSGDPWEDETTQRTLTVKVRTQSKGALLQAGTYMLRYGIASNKLYNTPDLTPCRHYTYWRATDVWLTNTLAGNDALDAIRDRLTTGVTIWRDPNEIGGDYLTTNIK